MIQARGLSKGFYGQAVLSRVSFEVERGESYVVLGQSGVGKSVLLKILAGLVDPDQGQLRVDSRNIGMLFQKNALFDSLNVYENLEFPLRERTSLRAEDRCAKIEKFLEWVGLSEASRLFPHELSGGMQKRLGIARALIVAPDMLFYDEPTAGLDPITSRLIAELMLRLKTELKSTIVVVTSDVKRACQLADRIGLLVWGADGASLLEAGTPAQAEASKDPAIEQFLKGLTKGPLTEPLSLRGSEGKADPLAQCGWNLTERVDVDFF